MAALRDYFNAVRAFSFPASALPSLTGSSIALLLHHHDTHFAFSTVNAALALLGCLSIHSFSNLTNDYFDFKSGLDSAENSGFSNPLVRGSLTMNELKNEMLMLLLISLLIATYFMITCGIPVVLLVGFGILSAWFYTAPPLKLKHRGLGDMQVSLSFGVFMTIGSYIVQTPSQLRPETLLTVFWISIPQSLLIAAILHANNHRDRTSDVKFGAYTLASRLGVTNSILLQYTLVALSYIAIVGISLHVSLFFLLTLMSIPQALRVIRNIRRNETPGSPAFRLLVVDAARLQLFFGLLMIAGVLCDLLLKR